MALSVAAGLSRNTVSQLEAERRIPRLPVVEQLANALGISPAWLAFGLDVQCARTDGELGCRKFAERAKQARMARGLTLREVGRRSASSAAAIRTTESGTMPSLDTVEALAKALGVSPAWLAYGEGPMEAPTRRRATQTEQVQTSDR